MCERNREKAIVTDQVLDAQPDVAPLTCKLMLLSTGGKLHTLGEHIDYIS